MIPERGVWLEDNPAAVGVSALVLWSDRGHGRCCQSWRQVATVHFVEGTHCRKEWICREVDGERQSNGLLMMMSFLNIIGAALIQARGEFLEAVHWQCSWFGCWFQPDNSIALTISVFWDAHRPFGDQTVASKSVTLSCKWNILLDLQDGRQLQ